MCCAIPIQSYQFERFCSQEAEEEDFPAIGKLSCKNILNFDSLPKKKPETRKCEKVHNNKDVPPQSNKKIDTNTPLMEKKKTEKKKKKWKALPLAETGFTISLFPRPIRPEMVDPEEEAKILRIIEEEQNDYEVTMDKYKNFDSKNCDPFEGICKGRDRFFRADRDRKVRKAGKQVKDKHCINLKNNDGRKKLYIHHRLLKLVEIELRRLSYLPSRTPDYLMNAALNRNRSTDSNRSKLKLAAPIPYTKPAPVQNLKHALHRTNVPTDIASDIANILINLQHRELTPEDYELLCRLDERVAPKTVSKDVLSALETDLVSSESIGEICTVCMDPYEIGQSRKFLPCNHVFHAKCIDMWLENSSQNCPVDGLPIDTSQ